MGQAKGIVGINALRQKAACHVRDPNKEVESVQERGENRMQWEGSDPAGSRVQER